jgi:hypothetical protein
MDIYYAGGLAGISEVLLTHPIDYLKTKCQEQYTIKEIVKNTKPLKYYDGIIPRLLGVIPMRLVFWGTQSQIISTLDKYKINTNYNFSLVGTGTAVCQTILDGPIEYAKITSMSRQRVLFKNLIKYKGFLPTLYRNVIFTNALTYMCYSKDKPSNYAFLNAIIGGSLGSILSQPFDYIKTIKQSPLYYGNPIAQKSVMNILFIKIKDNPIDLFKGYQFRLLLSASTMGIGFFSYNLILTILKSKPSA